MAQLEALLMAELLNQNTKYLRPLKKNVIEIVLNYNFPTGMRGDDCGYCQDGLLGAKGDRGEPGIFGIPGLQGLRGRVGARGPKGSMGNHGLPGLNGKRGKFLTQ